MLLTLTTLTPPARDIGFLLHKHPDRVQGFELSVGVAHVFYPDASNERCTAALLLDVDPIDLVRGRPSSTEGGLVDAYVNDRPYAASSFMSVAIARIFGPALGGRCDRPDLVAREMDLQAVVTPVNSADAGLADRLFAPLGYVVQADGVDVTGAARAGKYQRISLSATKTVRDALMHLYVLLPVMDDQKHYWVGEDEVAKLFRHGADWLPTHPERELIAKRYLKRAPSLARAAVARLRTLDEGETSATDTPSEGAREADLERPMRLQERRIEAVTSVLREAWAKTILDLGCGDGDLIAALARDPSVDRI
ncbi:MAG: 3' terminal RNA ribose 2'-O-methyltransferase Hen1, partial [Candidatus Eremiobacteraeota bacterium]|nr:3' terminal RNA ribose 2'-O-methyltransferase Hen1 [Candidatus Eremiobacteraeota bacterium]